MGDSMCKPAKPGRGGGWPFALTHRFIRDGRAVSAVEFALVLPIMITLYFGTVEITDGVIADRKVTAMTSAIGDLVAQAAVIEDAEMANIFKAASSIIAPYSPDPIKLVVTHVTVDEHGNGIVDWSDGLNRAGYSKGSTLTIPDGLASENTTLVVAEGSYLYTPILGQIITSSFTLEDTFYLRPRVVDHIDRP